MGVLVINDEFVGHECTLRLVDLKAYLRSHRFGQEYN